MKPFVKDFVFRGCVLTTLIVVAALSTSIVERRRGYDKIDFHGDISEKSIFRKVLHDPGAFTNSIVALFTGVLSLVSIAQLGFLLRADRNTRLSAEAALQAASAAQQSLTLSRESIVADRRAWLELTPALSNQPLHALADNMNTSVSMRFKNTGNSPALNITMNAWLIAEILPIHNKPSLLERHRLLCEQSRNRRIGTVYTLFPNETFPAAAHIGEFSLGVGIQGDAFREALFPTNEGNVLMLFIGGAVSYTFPTDLERVHQSSFLMRIETRYPHFTAIREGQTIPPNGMYLGGMILGDGRLAD